MTGEMLLMEMCGQTKLLITDLSLGTPAFAIAVGHQKVCLFMLQVDLLLNAGWPHESGVRARRCQAVRQACGRYHRAAPACHEQLPAVCGQVPLPIQP